MSYSIPVDNWTDKLIDDDDWTNLSWEALLFDDKTLVECVRAWGGLQQEAIDELRAEGADNGEIAGKIRGYEHPFEDCVSELQEDFFPKVNYAHVLQYNARASDLQEINEEGGNVAIIRIDDGHECIALTANGADLSQNIAHAYMLIDGEIPRDLLHEDGGRWNMSNLPPAALKKLNAYIADNYGIRITG